MGLLDGQIADLVYAGFKGKLLSGTLSKDAPGGTLDSLGDPTTETTTGYACQGFVDGYSDMYRAQAGIPQEDSKVSIFAKSLPAGVRPGKDDRVTIGGDIWQIRNVKTDPATALWECQAYVIG